jgi:hypothetical protein
MSTRDKGICILALQTETIMDIARENSLDEVQRHVEILVLDAQ